MSDHVTAQSRHNEVQGSCMSCMSVKWLALDRCFLVMKLTLFVALLMHLGVGHCRSDSADDQPDPPVRG